jgi:hypothetical protein
MIVELLHEIKAIKEDAFIQCISIQEILIPPMVRMIKRRAFSGCFSLLTVNLNGGLEETGVHGFCGCRSLMCIENPPLVRANQGRGIL